MIYENLIDDPFWRHTLHSADEQTVQAVNASLFGLDEEIQTEYRALRKSVGSMFPEILPLATSPLQFSILVLKLCGCGFDDGHCKGDGDDDLKDILNPNEILALKMILSKCDTAKFDSQIQSSAQRLADRGKLRDELTTFIKEKMTLIAPNVTAIVGPEIAAKLISATGGLVGLSQCPGNNIQVIGKTTNHTLNVGYVGDCDVIERIPANMQEYRKKVIRMIAAKVAIASRVDLGKGQFASGSFGMNLRAEIIAKLDKLVEPCPYRLDKPLPPPHVHSKKKRGGKRARKLKESTAMTAVRRQQNRIAFGSAEDELIVGDKVVGRGMLGTARITATDSKLREKLKRQSEKALTGIYSSSRSSSSANPFSFNAQQELLLKKQ